MLKQYFVFTSILVIGLSLHAAEIATPSGTTPPASTDQNLGTNMVGTSAEELSCLFMKGDSHVKEADAKRTAEGLENALKKLNFPPGKLTRTSLLHFMSQVIKESQFLQRTEQNEPTGKDKKGRPKKLSADQKGWGLIQVTTPAVMASCCECVDSCAAPTGTEIKNSPKTMVGNQVEDRTAAALLSLCWWKRSMLDNRQNSKISNQASPDASEKVTRLVNTGGLDKEVTGGKKNINERAEYFDNLSKADKGGVCRKI